MNIILGEENANSIEDRYIVLELDSLRIAGQPGSIKAYCVLEQLDLGEMMVLQHYRDLHNKLLENYRLQNWKFCQDAIDVLLGRWHGDLDSFYQDLAVRVQALQVNPPGPDWDGTIDKSNSLLSTPL